jgi:hypothetical protein
VGVEGVMVVVRERNLVTGKLVLKGVWSKGGRMGRGRHMGVLVYI